MTPSGPRARPALLPGTPVDVFNRFSDDWIGGFEIATALEGGYRLLRLSDQSVLPLTFRGDDLRRRHRF